MSDFEEEEPKKGWFERRRDKKKKDKIDRAKREQEDATKYKDEPFGGIFAFVRSKCGGNLQENGIVKTTASSTTGRCQPCQVADSKGKDAWMSKCEPNAWIMFDFTVGSVSPTHYSLRLVPYAGYPVKWRLDGSSDGNTWMVLDSRETRELSQDDSRGDNEGHTFGCKSNGQWYRYLRLTHTGQNRKDQKDCSGEFRLSEVEFFGKVRARAGQE